MSTAEAPNADVTQLRTGDRVEIHRKGIPPYIGIVENIAPQFHVIWIRDTTAGERQMLMTDECRIYRH